MWYSDHIDRTQHSFRMIWIDRFAYRLTYLFFDHEYPIEFMDKLANYHEYKYLYAIYYSYTKFSTEMRFDAWKEIISWEKKRNIQLECSFDAFNINTVVYAT